jgi:hypothetical protein
VFAQPLGVRGRRGFAARILFGRLGALNIHYRSQLAPMLGYRPGGASSRLGAGPPYLLFYSPYRDPIRCNWFAVT